MSGHLLPTAGWPQTARGLAGYAMDLWLLATNRFDHPSSYTKFRVIDAVRKETGARAFVEAGTYLGVTAARAATVFESVYTIELSRSLADRAKRLLAPKPNVHVVEGDALEVIPRLLRDEDVHDAIVFLDSHPCGSQTVAGALPEPAVEELRLLAHEARRLKAVIVDDFRLFGVESGYPSKGRLLSAAEELYQPQGFEVRVALDQLLVVARS